MRYTKEIFIEEAEDVHGGGFDYSEVEFVNMTTPVSIKCVKHDLMLHQSPNTHLFTGCPKCNIESRSEKHITELKKHLPSMGLELIEYVSTEEVYVSDGYGTMKTTKSSLLKGSLPSIQSAVDQTEYFINRAKEVHCGGYDYSKVRYGGAYTKVEIICNVCGSTFFQQATSHIQGKGCHKCGIKKQGGPKGRGRKGTPPPGIDRELLGMSFGE